MQSLQIRSLEISDRLIHDHWKADLINSAFNLSAIGKLIERTTHLVVLVRIPDPCTESAWGTVRIPA